MRAGSGETAGTPGPARPRGRARLCLGAFLIAELTLGGVRPSWSAEGRTERARSSSGSAPSMAAATDIPVTLVTGSTTGYYNQALGGVLAGTSDLFPPPNTFGCCPDITGTPEPDLGPAAGILGDWLSQPEALNANWSTTPVGIPSSWAINTEVAIVYPIDVGTCLQDVVANFGIDNGIFVWLDGEFKFGGLGPPKSYSAPLGDLTPGRHYIQILLQDYGGASSYSVSITGKVSGWAYAAGGGITSSPAVDPATGTLYFVPFAPGGDVTLHAVTRDGEAKWTLDLPDEVVGGHTVVRDPGTGALHLGGLGGYLYSIRDAGTAGVIDWKVRPLDLEFSLSTPTLGQGGTLFVYSEFGVLLAMDSATGALKTSVAADLLGEFELLDHSPIAGPGGVYWVGLLDGTAKLYALTGGGADPLQLRWSLPLPADLGASPPAIGPDGTLYISGLNGIVSAVTDEGVRGTLKWEYDTGATLFAAPSIGPDGTLYVSAARSNASGALLALADGGDQASLLWSVESDTARFVSTPAVGADGTVHVIDERVGAGGAYYVFAPDGSLRSTVEMGGGTASPSIVPGGSVYVGSKDGRLLSFCGPEGLATSSWPKFRADLGNTGRWSPGSGQGGLEPPTDLVATAASSTEVSLAWQDNSTAEIAFRIERSVEGSGVWTEIAQAAADAEAYPDTGLTPATSYLYRVRATAGSQNSAYSNVASVTTPSDELPTVIVQATAPVAYEDTLEAGRFTVTRLTASTSAPLTVFFEVSGTAQAGTDYAALGTAVQIPAGQPSVSIAVTPRRDTQSEPPESVELSLLTGPGYEPGVTASAAVTIVDRTPTVRVFAPDALAAEGGDQARLRITRTGSAAFPLTVDFVVSGTAGPADYGPPLGASATLAAGQLSRTLPIIPVNDGLAEGSETLTVDLVPADRYRLDPSASRAQVTIADNDRPTVSIVATDPTAVEGGDRGTFEIARTGSTAKPLTVRFTRAGTAGLSDYSLSPASPVTIPEGQPSVRVTLQATQDSRPEGEETAVLTLVPAVAYQIDPRAGSATVTIEASDALPEVRVEAGVASVLEDAQSPGTLVVSRTGSTAGSLLVRFQRAGSATAGTDYAPGLGSSVRVPAGSSEVTLAVNPVDDTRTESDETVELSIVPGSGYTVDPGGRRATVTIRDDDAPQPRVVRGPYLQMGTERSVVVRWRTDVPTTSQVRYGSAPGHLTSFRNRTASSTEHEVRVTGLNPRTVYYYSVGAIGQQLAGNDAEHFFRTAPPPGQGEPTRIWVLGDSGTSGPDAAEKKRVRDAYYELERRESRPTSLWLMLGDNAYLLGSQEDHDRALFGEDSGFPKMLRKSVLWPTHGNHEKSPDVYYDIFTLPTQGEAGGAPSGTECFYSFDHGDIHFVSLGTAFWSDACDSLSSDGAMRLWLERDLQAARGQKWLVAYVHAPPYTKAGRDHDSDTMTQSQQLRDTFLPLLEEHGVDLVLSGHNHVYERSFLLSGHYGTSDTFDAGSMLRDARSGRPDRGEEYVHLEREALAGTVYAVMGSSGGFPVLDSGKRHPVMFHSSLQAGSVVLDVEGDELRARFLSESADSIEDWFTIRHRRLESRLDANRDGTISFQDAADRTTPEAPLHFWTNGDRDGGDEDLDPQGGLADGLDQEIRHIRDLEDFVRVHVKLPADAGSGTKLTAKLIGAAAGESPAVNLWQAARPGLDYLTDAAAAREQVSLRRVLTVETGGLERDIPRSWWRSSGGRQQVHLLLEGRGAGKGAIQFSVYEGGRLIGSDRVHLALREVEQMYDHFTVGDTVDLPVELIPPVADRLGQSVVPQTPDYLLLVHGWRMRPWERRSFGETAYKRLWHQGFRGGLGLFSWPTEWNDGAIWSHALDPQNYARSEQKAYRSAVGLHGVLKDLNAAERRGKVRLVAHSLGNVVASEALLLEGLRLEAGQEQEVWAETYVPSQAASVARAYDAGVPLGGPYQGGPDVYGQYPPTGSPYFEGLYRVATKVANYRNELDFALGTPWRAAQSLKPWPNYSTANGQFVRLVPPAVLTFPADRDEIFAFAARASSQALGAQAGVSGIVTGELDLTVAPIRFGASPADHSGQFGSHYMGRRHYWNRLLWDGGLKGCVERRCDLLELGPGLASNLPNLREVWPAHLATAIEDTPAGVQKLAQMIQDKELPADTVVKLGSYHDPSVLADNSADITVVVAPFPDELEQVLETMVRGTRAGGTIYIATDAPLNAPDTGGGHPYAGFLNAVRTLRGVVRKVESPSRTLTDTLIGSRILSSETLAYEVLIRNLVK